MKPECSWMWASSQKKPSTGWKMFPARAGRSHFSWSSFQMQDTEDEMSASVCLSVCFSTCMPLPCHVCSQAQSMSIPLMKDVKRWGFLQVDIMIGCWWRWWFKLKESIFRLHFSCNYLAKVFYFLSRNVHFTSQAKLKKNILYFCSATQQVKGGYAAALFLTLTLLLTPIETVCQSNHAPSQTSPRVECWCTFSTM